MILDATAGNRTMWSYKDSDQIIYIDIEKQLEIKPTIFASCESTPFKDKQFHTIFYDPPHTWRDKPFYYSFPSKQALRQVYPSHKGMPTYYGWDKYPSRLQLNAHIYRSQQEFQRILKDDGLLFFKWNEVSIPLRRILTVFHEWTEVMRLHIRDPMQTAGQHQTYWVILTKKPSKSKQTTLEDRSASLKPTSTQQ